jgi:hypothetical protein
MAHKQIAFFNHKVWCVEDDVGLPHRLDASALTHSDDAGSLSSLAKIEAADAFQTKGFGSALCSAR